ncbi:MAG TPA: hypothetical protein VGN26_07105 [Armatimonadota bacterium]|jgi:hypothetical protein
METSVLPIRLYGDFVRELGKAVERAGSFAFEGDVLVGLQNAVAECADLHEGFNELTLTADQCEQLADVVEFFINLRIDPKEASYERLTTFVARLRYLSASSYIRR